MCTDLLVFSFSKMVFTYFLQPNGLQLSCFHIARAVNDSCWENTILPSASTSITQFCNCFIIVEILKPSFKGAVTWFLSLLFFKEQILPCCITFFSVWEFTATLWCIFFFDEWVLAPQHIPIMFYVGVSICLQGRNCAIPIPKKKPILGRTFAGLPISTLQLSRSLPVYSSAITC